MTASPGIVVLDRSGHISFTTEVAAALLRLGDGLTVRDARLIGRQGVNNHPWRVFIGGERLGKRPPHQRRRIVQQHDHGAFGCGAIV